MRKIIFLVFLMLVCGIMNSQNLFVNGDFETVETGDCPRSEAVTNTASWDNVTGWTALNGHTGSADPYYTCDTYGVGSCVGEEHPECNWKGRQTGAEGTAQYSGITVYRSAANNKREYLVAEFTSPLVAGTTYELEFYASLSSFSSYYITGIQWLFTNTIPTTPANDRSLGVNANGPILPSPGQEYNLPISDSVNWTEITSCYTANGGEQYLVIGNFYRDNNINPTLNPGPDADPNDFNSHYYFDQFSLEAITVNPDASFSMTPDCTSATATVTGDSGGTFSFNPAPTDGATINAATGEISNGTPGETYTVEYTVTGACAGNDTETVNVTLATGSSDASFSMTPDCTSATATITGDSGGTFSFDPLPTDGATIDATSGSISNGTPGTTYSVVYTLSGTGTCGVTMETVSVQLDNTPSDASFALTPICGGATVTILGDQNNGVFIFDPLPTDSAQIDSATGEISNGTPGTTYTVEYTVTGASACLQANSTQSVTIPNTTSNATFTISPLCSGTSAAVISGDTGGVFSFNPAVTDGAIINASTGEVSNGVSGASYTIEYAVTATGDCIEGTSTQTVVIPTLPETSFTETTIVVDEDETPITLTAIADNYNVADVTIQWYYNGDLIVGETDLLLTNVEEAGNYEIVVTETFTNCVSEPVSVNLVINPILTGIIPQGISPNGDGLNDSFDLTGLNVESASIFNRYGTEVFVKSDGYIDEWYGQDKQGNDLPTGIYYYVLKFESGEVKASWVYVNRAQ